MRGRLELVDVYFSVQVVLLVGGSASILLSTLLFRRSRLAIRVVRETAHWDARVQDMASRYVLEMEDRRKATYTRVHDIVISRPFLVAVPFIVGLAGLAAFYFTMYAVAVGAFVPALVAIIVLRAAIEPADAIESSVFLKFVAAVRDSSLNPEDKSRIEDAVLELKRGSAYFFGFGVCQLAILGLDRYLDGTTYSGLSRALTRALQVGIAVDFVRFWALLVSVTLVSFVFIKAWSHRGVSRPEEPIVTLTVPSHHPESEPSPRVRAIRL